MPPLKKTRTPSEHYVNNAEFFDALVEYRNLVNECRVQGVELPPVTEYIGTCIVKIANHLSTKANFVSYTYREEMVLDGIENCLTYLGNFDPQKSNNPFAYFTQICYYAFVRRIQRERKQEDLKDRYASHLIEKMPTDLAEALDSIRDRVHVEGLVRPKILKRPKYLDQVDPEDDTNEGEVR
jgi:hypothetical protein